MAGNSRQYMPDMFAPWSHCAPLSVLWVSLKGVDGDGHIGSSSLSEGMGYFVRNAHLP